MHPEPEPPLGIHTADHIKVPTSESQFEIKEDPAAITLESAKQLTALRGRADTKIRYAKLVLQELKTRERAGGTRGDDFDRSHEESFLFHLLGALDAFAEELNIYYDCGLRTGPEDHVSRGKMWKVLEQRGRKSKELEEIHDLEQEKTSWLFHARKMRHHSTHVWGVVRTFFVGGVHDGEIWFKNPEALVDVEQDVYAAFAEWANEMESLLERLRKSAIEANKARLLPEITP